MCPCGCWFGIFRFLPCRAFVYFLLPFSSHLQMMFQIFKICQKCWLVGTKASLRTLKKPKWILNFRSKIAKNVGFVCCRFTVHYRQHKGVLEDLDKAQDFHFFRSKLYVVNSMWIVHCREHRRILEDLDKAQVDVVLLFMLFILFVLF